MARKKDANGKWPKQKSKKSGTSGSKHREKTATSGTGKKYAYCFTLNNYTWEEEYYIASATKIYPDNIIYVDYGKEKGESGTPHLQGQIEMNIECM